MGLDLQEKTSTALFDVTVKVPKGARMEDIERQAREAGIGSDRMDPLMKALRSIPEAKIGAAVSKERADRAKEQFTKAGLLVEIVPVLAIAASAFEDITVCPGCGDRVTLPENRQCPHCGVFVDKMTDEYLLRKKLVQKERAIMEAKMDHDGKKIDQRSKQSVEAALREKVRKEVEAEYGVKKGGLLGNAGGILKMGVMLIAGVGIALYASGNGLSSINPWASKKTSAQAVDKMLATVGPAGTGVAGAAGAAGAEAGGAGTATGDPDIDDPLIQAAGGKRIGAKGLTMEQAVAAAQVLGKSVGNTTADRAMAGAAPVAGASGAAGTTGAAASAAAAGVAQAGGATGQPIDTSKQADIPIQSKLLLKAEFAKTLAEMGQDARARGVMKALESSPNLSADPLAARAVRIAGIEVRAWGLRAGPSRQALEALRSDAAGLGDAGERTIALSRMGAIISTGAQVPADVPRAFLTLGAESLKSISDSRERNAAASDWAVALGQVLVAEATTQARVGNWNRVKAASAQLDTLVKGAPDDFSLARLYAIDYRMKQQVGQSDVATQSLSSALALAGKQSSLPEQAAWLRRIARLAGAADNEKLQAAVNNLQTQAAGKTGIEKAQTMANLALLFADAGSRGKASQFSQLAQSATGLSPAETVSVNSDIIVRGDLAVAKALHGFGMYPDSEVLIQRVGGYLL